MMPWRLNDVGERDLFLLRCRSVPMVFSTARCIALHGGGAGYDSLECVMTGMIDVELEA